MSKSLRALYKLIEQDNGLTIVEFKGQHADHVRVVLSAGTDERRIFTFNADANELRADKANIARLKRFYREVHGTDFIPKTAMAAALAPLVEKVYTPKVDPTALSPVQQEIAAQLKAESERVNDILEMQHAPEDQAASGEPEPEAPVPSAPADDTPAQSATAGPAAPHPANEAVADHPAHVARAPSAKRSAREYTVKLTIHEMALLKLILRERELKDLLEKK